MLSVLDNEPIPATLGFTQSTWENIKTHRLFFNAGVIGAVFIAMFTMFSILLTVNVFTLLTVPFLVNIIVSVLAGAGTYLWGLIYMGRPNK